MKKEKQLLASITIESNKIKGDDIEIDAKYNGESDHLISAIYIAMSQSKTIASIFKIAVEFYDKNGAYKK